MVILMETKTKRMIMIGVSRTIEYHKPILDIEDFRNGKSQKNVPAKPEKELAALN